ncbi:hypothetical protein EBZ39_08145, partial [bacterium]|nr:hypothetical protein [bacterium]
MSVHAPYTLLLEVASCDARVSHLTQTVADLSKKIAAQQQSFATYQEACACAPATLLGMKKAIDDLELQLKSIDDQLKHKKQQLDLITSEKQLHALEHEIAMLLRKKEELSDLQVDQWLAYETAQQEQEAQQSSTATQLEQLGADIASLESELEQAQISLANAEQGRQTALANLP